MLLNVKTSNEAAHQFARITAFPGGDGELQQVDVQNAHIICVAKNTKGVFY